MVEFLEMIADSLEDEVDYDHVVSAQEATALSCSPQQLILQKSILIILLFAIVTFLWLALL